MSAPLGRQIKFYCRECRRTRWWERPARNAASGRETWRPGLVRFRKHHRPCGQPAVEGGIELFRPVPAQAGHFIRINAMPSDLPLMSTGLATNPVPPQRGQSFGVTRPPQLPRVFHQIALAALKSVLCYEKRTSGPGGSHFLRCGRARFRLRNYRVEFLRRCLLY